MVGKPKPVLKVCSLIVIAAMYLAMLATPLSITLATEAAEPTAEHVTKLVVRAKALQLILRRSLALGLPQELASEVEALLNVNISSLATVELGDYIARCREVLAKIERELAKARTDEVDARYVLSLRIAVETRLRAVMRMYNISVDKALWNLSEARDRAELYKALKRVSRVVEEHNARIFAGRVLKRFEATLDRLVEKEEVGGIEKALDELDKAAKVIARTVKRLENLGIPTEAAEHLRKALEHISVAKEVLSNISAGITAVRPEKARERVREVVNRTFERLYNHVNETLTKLRLELQELMERALELNATEALEKLENLMQKIDGIYQALHNELANLTVYKLHRVLMVLSEIRAELKLVEKSIDEELPRWMPEKSIDRAYNVTLAKALKNLEEVKKIIEEIERRSKDLICIAIYPPPPACRFIHILPEVLAKAKSLVAEAEELINKSIELYNAGLKTAALRLVAKANAILVNVRAWLMPIYNALLVKPEEVAERLSQKLEEVAIQIEKAKEKVNNILNRLEGLRPMARKAVERMLSEVKEMIGRAEEIAAEAREALRSGDSVNARILIANLENIVRDIYGLLSSIEKSLS